MTDDLSPFVFKKFSLKHLEIDKEITLKFRKATMVDTQELRESFGGPEKLQEALKDAVRAVEMLFRFLCKDSKKALASIRFTDIDDKTGEEIEVKKTLKEKYLMIFISRDETQKEIFQLFLSVFGYSQKDIDVIMGVAEKEEEKTQKKTQETTQVKKP